MAILLIGLFMLLAHFLGRNTPIETELAAAMKQGMTAQQRIDLSRRVVEMLDRPGRGQPDATLLLLSLGRIWQGPPENSPGVSAARQRATQCLLGQLSSPDVARRKAAALAFAFWKGNPETAAIAPRLIEKLPDAREDLDVRIASAVALGAIGSASDKAVIDALERARNLSDERQAELSWNAALSLARLGRPSAAGTLLKLLDRGELARLTIFDREADPRNPRPRKLSDYEIERFLINAIEASSALPDPAVLVRLRLLAQSDPSARVRTAAARFGTVRN
ncbi:MAG: HEAT repeat domain-containing protein [Tepidisphaerales bacterium]